MPSPPSLAAGYSDGSIVRHGVLSAEVSFLAKPITVAALTAKVREVLDGPAPALVADA